MTESEFDRIMANAENVVPSSGFAESVMDAVRREAAIPKPIPFPWLRALPGLVAGVIAIVLVVVAISSRGGNSAAALIRSDSGPGLDAVMHAATSPVAIWTGFVLLLTFASFELSMRFCRGRA